MYYLSCSGCNNGPHLMISHIFSIFRKQLHEISLQFVPYMMFQLIVNSFSELGAFRMLSVYNYAHVLENHRTVLQRILISQGFDGITHNKTFN